MTQWIHAQELGAVGGGRGNGCDKNRRMADSPCKKQLLDLWVPSPAWRQVTDTNMDSSLLPENIKPERSWTLEHWLTQRACTG